MEAENQREDGFSSGGSNDYDGEEDIGQQETDRVEEKSLEEILQEDKELKGLDMETFKQEGEVLKKLLEGDSFTGSDKTLLQGTLDQWKLFEDNLQLWLRQKESLKMVWVLYQQMKDNTFAMLSHKTETAKMTEEIIQQLADEVTMEELEKSRCNNEGEALNIMLGDDHVFTADERAVLQETLERCMSYEETMKQLAEEDCKLTSEHKDLTAEEYAQLEDTLRNKLKTAKESFDKMLEKIDDMGLRKRGPGGKYYSKPPQLPANWSSEVGKL